MVRGRELAAWCWWWWGWARRCGRRRRQAYGRVRNIMIPDMYYRTDIGDRWFEDHDRLHTWGYLREV